MKQILRRTVFLLLAAAVLLSFGGCSNKGLIQFEAPKKGQQVAEINVENYGTIKVMLFEEQAPKAVENFVTHAKEGYYDGLTFHRIIDNFMIQGGDPDGDGTGGESIWGEPFEDEFSDQLRNFTGALSMANSGADTNGSQFFIVNTDPFTGGSEELDYYNKTIRPTQGHAAIDYPAAQREKYIEAGGTPWLDNVHTVFGQVYEGLDVVTKIMSEASDSDEPVVIKSITVSTYGE
ncbi:MAG: peptidylprolyl isomerase [Oscillospiraceae bacterium]|nr:peptidylprolyl isomerase [Oscillospiraceae bacterium]MDY3065676.1 peptidylprolyl isomerase [Oscillospiraceae bacterium]